jgi:hypothetical protein
VRIAAPAARGVPAADEIGDALGEPARRVGAVSSARRSGKARGATRFASASLIAAAPGANMIRSAVVVARDVGPPPPGARTARRTGGHDDDVAGQSGPRTR